MRLAHSHPTILSFERQETLSPFPRSIYGRPPRPAACCVAPYIQGCSPEKRSGGTPETRLRQRFLNNIQASIHAHSYTSEKFCCTEIILHCVSVGLSNQLQLQWTNFRTNFNPKSEGVEDAPPPCRKKVGRRCPLARPRPTTPLFLAPRDTLEPFPRSIYGRHPAAESLLHILHRGVTQPSRAPSLS